MVRTILLGLSIAGLIPTALAMATVLENSRETAMAKQSQPRLQSTKIGLAKSCLSAVSSTVCSTNVSQNIPLNSHLWLQDAAEIFFSRSLLSNCMIKASQNIGTVANLGGDARAITQFSSQEQGGLPLSRPARNSSCLFTWQNRRTERAPKAASSNTLQQKIKSNINSNIESASTDSSIAIDTSINASLNTSQPQAKFSSSFPKLSRSSLIVSSFGQNSYSTVTRAKLLNPAPKTKRIASPFGWRQRPYSNQLQFHQGIDYGAPFGSPVVAAGNGIVTNVSSGCADFGNLFCGGQLGNWIEVDHGNGAIATYGHLKHNTISVTKGAKVWRNQEIAQVGSSGWSTGAHLDFRLKVNGSYQDPAKYVMKTNKAKLKSAQNSQLNKKSKFIH